MLLIASSISLLAIVAGVFLYAKTIKDNLNRRFKAVACFVVVVGFLNLFAAHAFFTGMCIYKMAAYHNRMEMGWGHQYGMKMKGCNHNNSGCEGMCGGNCEDKMMKKHWKKMMMMEGKEDCGMMAGMKYEKEMMEDKECMKGKMKKDSVMRVKYVVFKKSNN